MRWQVSHVAVVAISRCRFDATLQNVSKNTRAFLIVVSRYDKPIRSCWVATGLPSHQQSEQQSAGQQNVLLQQLQASRLPQPPMMGPMPGLLNPQQLQALIMFRQNPALFSNPVLQSQLAMLMWTQMQQQPHAAMWPPHQPPLMLQLPTVQQPSSAAAQSASTHQPSCQGPLPLTSGSGRLSDECNSSGGSNDSGCMQTISGSTPQAGQSPPADAQFTGQRFADDSDSAVTWADRAGRGADQTGCTQSRSASHPEASGTAPGSVLHEQAS